MPTLTSIFHSESPSHTSGYTLVEMVVSIAISTLIIGGSTYFILKSNTEAQAAKARTTIHTEMTTFVDKLNQLRTNYSSGSILVNANPGYDVLLLVNSGATNGALVGVVNLKNSDGNGSAKLDASGNFGIYDNKVLGIQELTKSQIASLLTIPSSAYAVLFQSDRFYPALLTKDFSITAYNS